MMSVTLRGRVGDEEAPSVMWDAGDFEDPADGRCGVA
jgi:hypothetical protein